MFAQVWVRNNQRLLSTLAEKRGRASGGSGPEEMIQTIAQGCFTMETGLRVGEVSREATEVEAGRTPRGRIG